MDHFVYRQGELCCEQVRVAELAAEYGTPLFVYSRQTFLDHFDRLREAFAELNPVVCFSVKSCHNLHLLRLLKDRGAGFDVVSGGELSRALEIGADPTKLVFAGVGKTDDELRLALGKSIGWFNVESEQELARLGEIASEMGVVARAALRINPDVDPHTHEYTTTGKKQTKFGIDADRAARVFDDFAALPGVRLTGIHIHIGSPVNQVTPYVESVTRTLEVIETLRRTGHAVEALNIGGGFGAHYEGGEAPPAAAYAQTVTPLLRGSGLQVLLEPGRSIAANGGILIGRTLYTKSSGRRNFLITDASMTELIRPALYGAYHFVWPVCPTSGMVPAHRGKSVTLEGGALMDVVGPVCESGDFLAKDRWLPPMRRGDLLAVFTAGAYGSVMGSHYNSRPKAAEVLVEGDRARLVRRRETYDDLVAAERL